MANVKHSELLDPEIHNPKDFAAAANDTYLGKNSSGNLEWLPTAGLGGGGGGGTSPGGVDGDIQINVSGTFGTDSVFRFDRTNDQLFSPELLGSSSASGNLLINSTTDATKGRVHVGEDTSLVVVGDDSNISFGTSNAVVALDQSASQEGLLVARSDQAGTFKTNIDAIEINPQGQCITGYGDFFILESKTKANVLQSRVVFSGTAGAILDPFLTLEEKSAASVATPSTNRAAIFLDAADGALKIKFDSGNTATIQAAV